MEKAGGKTFSANRAPVLKIRQNKRIVFSCAKKISSHKIQRQQDKARADKSHVGRAETSQTQPARSLIFRAIARCDVILARAHTALVEFKKNNKIK